MSYLRLLDEARSHLDRGDLLAAEESLARAHDAWSSSRVRAPLIEKGVEPALRAVSRLFGRRNDRPVLPVFSDRARRLEDDLAASANLFEREAQGIAVRAPAEQGESDRRTLESALRLQKHSRFFALTIDDHWAVTRAYLESCRRLSRIIRADLLPESLLPDEHGAWFEEWVEAWLAVADPEADALAQWLRRQALALAQGCDPEESGSWHWITVRLCLLDPGAAPDALRAVREALSAGLDRRRETEALVCLAELLSNAYRIATPGADVEESLSQWEAKARSVGMQWPPSGVDEILAQRRVRSASTSFVAVAWDAQARAVCFVLHVGDRPCDALFARVRDDAAGDLDPWAATVPELRGWLSRWAPEKSLYLCAEEPEEWMRVVLAAHPVIAVGPLLRAVCPHERADAPAAPVASHPVWSGGGCDPWSELAASARELAPGLRSLLAGGVAFRSAWGLGNLRRLGQHGVSLCASLADAVEAFGLEESFEASSPVELQDVVATVRLQWPRLRDRPWIPALEDRRVGSSDVTPADGSDEASVWYERTADADELAAWAGRSRSVEVLTHESSRARGIAVAGIAHVAPERVTVAPREAECVEMWLRFFESLVGEAVVQPERAADIVWVLRCLCEDARGAITESLGAGGSERLREEIAARHHEGVHACDEQCRLRDNGGCLPQQLEERRREGGLWIVPLPSSRMAASEDAVVLVDDLRAIVCGVDDARALSRLEHLRSRIRRAKVSRIYTPSCGLGSPLQASLHESLGERRALRRVGATGSTVALWFVGPGYAPGSSLLGEESERLLRSREAIFAREHPEAKSWSPGDENAGLDSHASETVYCADLAQAETRDPMLFLLRAAAAASRAKTRLVCLDPRLAEILSHPGGLWSGRDDFEVGSALATGASLFSDRTLAPPAWAHPLSASRLGAAGLQRSAAIAKALHDLRRGRPHLVGGLTEAERDGVVDVVQRLAEESRDGGPLQVRCVITIREGEPLRGRDARVLALGAEDAGQLEGAFLDLERGAVTRLEIVPALLSEPALQRWARRNGSVLWVLRHAERATLAAHRLGTTPWPTADAAALIESLERAGSLCLGFCDEFENSPESTLNLVAERLHAEIRSVVGGIDDADWVLRPLPLPIGNLPCWGCREEVDIERSLGVCPNCGRGHDVGPASRRAIALELEENAVSILRRSGPQARWRLLVFDPEQRRRLEQRLGVRGFEKDSAPLLTDGAQGEANNSVVLAEDLWRDGLDPLPVYVLGVPPRAAMLRAIFLRAQALGWPPSEIVLLLPPPAASVRVDLPPGPYRWVTPRPQVIARAREELQRAFVHAPRSTDVALGPELGASRLDPRDPTETFLVERGIEDVQEHDTVEAAIGALEAAGVRFGSHDPVWLDVALLQSQPARPGPFELLDWAWRAGYLESEPIESADPASIVDLELERQLHEGRSQPIAWQSLRRTQELRGKLRRPVEPVERPTLWAIAGHGRSRWLGERVLESVNSGARCLVVVPGETQEFTWSLRAAHRFDVCVASAIALAVLHRDSDTSATTRWRLLPPASRPDGKDARLRLMRETSRRYAAVAGHVPSIDSRELERVVEGGTPRTHGSADGLDLELLARSATESRRSDGWVNEDELWQTASILLDREPRVVESWRARYGAVFIDDLHRLSSAALEFVRQVFGPQVLASTGDVLRPGDHAVGAVGSDQLVSERLRREVLAAVEDAWREHAPLPGRLKSSKRNREKAVVERSRFLNLQAIKVEIAARLESDLRDGRVGIFSSNEDDREALFAYLAQLGHPVHRTGAVVRRCSGGVRELVACMCLVLGPGESTVDQREAWVRLLIGCGPAPERTTEAADQLRRLESHLSGEETAIVDSAQAHLARLAGVRIDPLEQVSVEGLALRVLRTGILDRVLAWDSARARVHRFLDRDGRVLALDFLASLDTALLTDPLGTVRSVWILDPEGAEGLEFDHVLHLCSGYEEPVRHYAALSRAIRSVSVLYAEQDPLGGRG